MRVVFDESESNSKRESMDRLLYRVDRRRVRAGPPGTSWSTIPRLDAILRCLVSACNRS